MEKIMSFIKKPVAIGLAGLMLGLVIGLVVLGWGIWPVQYVDAAPADLQMDYQRDYLCMVIDSFTRNQDGELVQLRWDGLGENANELLSTLTPALCRYKSDKEIVAFGQLVNAGAVALPSTTEEVVAEEPVDETGEEPAGETAEELAGEAIPPLVVAAPFESQAIIEPEKGSFSLLPLVMLMLLTLVVGGVFVFLLIRRKQAFAGSAPKAARVKFTDDQAIPVGRPETKVSQNEPALAQFMTTYRQGDDLYDDSFSIDSINGEFLGECGVGIAETIGVGEPKKVTALEVWLFDKNDIQTVTKVLLSEHANSDAAIKQRLLSKGEPIVVEPGMRFLMETASLQLEAKVVDMVYARGPLPENSYFSRLTLEISVWSK
jgi:hypothetical protein